MALTLHVRSGIVDAVLCVIIDIVLLYFIGRLFGILGFLLDLRRLRSRGRIRIKEIDFPVVGSVRRTLGGYFTFVSMVLVFISILVVETGMNGSTVKREGELFRFKEVRYLSIDYFNNTRVDEIPRFHNSGEARRCQSLQGDWKVQYGEFRGFGLGSGDEEKICSTSTNTSFETLRVSGKTGRMDGQYVCERENVVHVGDLRTTSESGRKGISGISSDSFFSCRVKVEAEEPAEQDNIADAKIWYFNESLLLDSASTSDPWPVLLSYRNKSDGENFYRVAGGYMKENKGNIRASTYLVREQFLSFVDDEDSMDVENKVMQTSCKDVSCLLSKRRSGLSNSTIATWLHWHIAVDAVNNKLGLVLDATFNEKFSGVLISDNRESERGSAFVTLLEGDEEDVTLVSIYSAIILVSLLVLALIAIIISETTRRKKWKCYGVDITCFERNKLFCQIYNKSRLTNDESCLENAKDLILVASSDESGKKLKISVENRNEVHLLQKVPADDCAV